MLNKNKELWKPGTLLMPVPAVMVSCADSKGKANIITIAWAGTINSEPPMLSISVRPNRFSYHIIEGTKEFVVNIPDKNTVFATDLCGVKSGRAEDKFLLTGLSKGKASTVSAPIILECPMNLECKVRQQINLGSHTMFIAEITAVQVSSNLINKDGKFDIEKAETIGFAHGNYFKLGKKLGSFGFSVKKK